MSTDSDREKILGKKKSWAILETKILENEQNKKLWNLKIFEKNRQTKE